MLLKSFVKSICLFGASLAFAETQHEISGGTGAGIQYFKAGTTEFTEIDAFVSYSKRAKFWELAQMGGVLQFNYYTSSSGQSTQDYAFFLSPTVNFSNNFKSSAYVKPGAGFFYTKSKNRSDFDFAVFLSSGIRQEIAEDICYNPHITAYFIDRTNADALDLRVIPLSFSLFFE